MKNNKIPILLIAFKRPHETLRVLSKIKKYYPDNLYYFVDTSLQDIGNVKKVRDLISLNKYAVKTHIKFQKKNLGCGKGPVTAINWIMSKEKYAIILEDDCVPLDGFFKFMEWSLKNKKNDKKCFMVSGNNFLLFHNSKVLTKTKFAFTHGWGTWRRAWRNYDYNISSWKILKNKNVNFIPYYARFRWKKIFNNIIKDEYKTYWDYQWQYHLWKHDGYAIQPPVNLVKNIGYGKSATHTTDRNDWRGKLLSKKLPKNFKKNIPKFSIIAELNNTLIDLNILTFIPRVYKKFKKLFYFLL